MGGSISRRAACEASIQVDLSGLRRFTVSRLAPLRSLLPEPENVCQARAVLAERTGKIRLFRKGAGGYPARGSLEFFGANELLGALPVVYGILRGCRCA
jgi:hypothetical protein